MSDFRISVCIPAYNEEESIESCINSIQSQLDVDILEILVGVNGSTDETRNIVEKMSVTDKRIRIVDSPKGKAHAWNCLNAAAREDVRIFQDGDTVIKKHVYMNVIGNLVAYDVVSVPIHTKMITHDFLVRVCNFPSHGSHLQKKLCGGLYAFRHSDFMPKMQNLMNTTLMPTDLINDDTFIQLVADSIYISDISFVSVESEDSFKSVISRYKRMRKGREQIKRLYPDLFNRKIIRAEKSPKFQYLVSLFKNASYVEKLFFIPMMVFKKILMNYVKYLGDNQSPNSTVAWK